MALEDVVIDSRWKASGAGRADIDITGGDLPASTPKVDAVESWASDFTQRNYSDSVGFAPPAGAANRARSKKISIRRTTSAILS